MLPSELARRLTREEFTEMIAFQRIKRRKQKEAEDTASG